MGREVILAIDDSAVSKDTVRWAIKQAVIGKGDKVTLLSVLEPAVRPDFVAAGESSYPVEEYAKVLHY